ncbi:MAG: UDP-N-acetylmuramate dehydrogenase [Candidatus Pseudobacter hemicellulosilyticus]|uniref:UDP-N-acetylenolpyruvoylglucosamine reductase n=1 Tax=Candidatus Pseudobacter hemicellulosilyticus TaxID=3121375 RepID=A0AAJ6BFY4_9BACT|nr:MAG: UDP-N-acetylmuramate dehydrogenase [Pseudobacter sp.]
MINIQQNSSLRPYNTMGIDVPARYFSTFSSTEELQELLAIAGDQQPLILGGGSNILLTQPVDGYVFRNALRGFEVVKEDEQFVYVKAGAGEQWHQFVQYCISHNLGGVENLSLIPGLVGASPMQNIGAYGVEIKDVFFDLEALHIADGVVRRFSLEECAFGYRESVFKRQYKGQYIILNVTYRLCKSPVFNTRYGAIAQELEAMGVQDLSLQAVSQAVINIRRSKLPDPAVIGNAGSFFKNPSIPASEYTELQGKYPAIVGYANADGTVKIAAGWLIEQCGWKGVRRGDAGCHERQALVLVNYGNATGKEIYALSEEIVQSVKSRFGVDLEREVNIV